jgi:hypothetical protein
MLKGQLHTHTTFSDGTLTPQQLADVYTGLGFDFIAITDHDHLLKPSYMDMIQKIKSSLTIFNGIELTVHCSKGYVHVNRIEGEREVLHVFNHPADYDLSLRDTISMIAEVSALYPLDAIEVTNHGFYTPQFDTATFPYIKVAADDCHNRLGCGRGWIEVEAPRDKDAIITAIKAGHYRNRFAGKSVREGSASGIARMRFA